MRIRLWLLSLVLFLQLGNSKAQLSITSMPLSVCGQSNFTVQLGGTFVGNAGNQFAIQLSDSLGNFSNPTIIGTLNAAIPAAVSCSISNLSISGVNYRLRATATSPSTISLPGPTSLVYHAPDVPPLNPSGQTPICGNSQVIMFTGNRPFIQWLRNGNPIPGANTPVFQTNQVGIYTVRSGPSASCSFLSQPTNVIQGVLPNANQITGPNKICPGGTINLQVQDQIIEWHRNGVVVAGGIQPFQATSPGQYRAVVQNQTGCSTLSNSHDVQLDTTPVNKVKVTQGQLCVNQQAVLTGGTGVSYQWYIKSPNGQGPNLSALPQFSFTAPNAGIYPPLGDSLCLQLTGNNGCLSINCFKDTVGVAPPKPGIIKNGPTLISTNLLGNAWHNVVSGFIPGATNRSFTAVNSGQYYVVTIDPVGCRSPNSDTVSVLFTSQFNQSNSDGLLFPSPATHYFRLRASDMLQGEISISIYSVAGQIVHRFSVQSNELESQQFDITMLPSGIYGVEVMSKSGSAITKLVINRR